MPSRGTALESRIGALAEKSLKMRWLVRVLLLSLVVLGAAEARRPRVSGRVQLEVLRQQQASTGDPGCQLFEFEVRCTNQGNQSLRISNNQFVVVDDLGAKHLVERGRYPDRQVLDPGKPVVFSRIFIAVPRERKPRELQLLNLGSCRLK